MYFQHSDDIWVSYPELVAGVVHASGITASADVDKAVARFQGAAESRLAAGPASEFPEIRAWRRTFTRMGLKSTQYRSASESLLRRFAKDRTLPRIHPLIDLCNAVSLAYAVPIAVFDTAKIADGLEVRHARGDETYLTFAGETEHPAPREVIFADDRGRAHARRWTNRQSGYSAVRESTSEVLIVAEAMHDTATMDVPALLDALAGELTGTWSSAPETALPSRSAPRFTG
jgi:DNA/RNA-binding domain of Phe-tRNA-synthetase-like protein